MSEKSSQKWNAVAHEALLFAMVEEFRPSKDKIVSIVERMSQQGHHFTFNGVKYLAVPLPICLWRSYHAWCFYSIDSPC